MGFQGSAARALASGAKAAKVHEDAGPRSARLGALLTPRSVAVVGISADPGKLGNVILGNVVKNGFAGRIYGVCRSRQDVGSVRAPGDRVTLVGAFEDIPEPVDIVLFAVPAERLLSAIREVPPARMHVAVAIASGFSEVGAEGARLEAQLREYCDGAGVALVGPNCQGVVVPSAGLQMTFSPMYNQMVHGSVAVVSQSGAMGGYMANRLMQRGVGLSCFVSSGNETVVNATDYIAALGDDRRTRVILCYLEQIKNGRRFAEVAREVSRTKPIVIVKSGRSAAGVVAVGSHTGAIAGDDAVTSGVFQQVGVIRARDSATAVDAAIALSAGKPLTGPRIGVLSVAGGLAVELTDLLEMQGFEVPEFDSETRRRLDAIMPAFGATRNPIDLTGAVLTQEGLFESSIEIFGAAENVEGLAVISTYIADPRFARAIVRLFERSGKPVVVCWTGSMQQTPESLRILADAGVPVYDNPARVATAFRALRRDPSIE